VAQLVGKRVAIRLKKLIANGARWDGRECEPITSASNFDHCNLNLLHSYQQFDSPCSLDILFMAEGGNPAFPSYTLTICIMKTALVTVQRKGAINIPAEIRTEAGIAQGDMLEASLRNGKIILVPKVDPIVKTIFGPQ
jgi:AbrB family looped-hinge helix DNA binding protein